MPSECSGSPPRSYIPVLDPSQLSFQQLYSLALSEDDGAQCLHFCQQLVQQLVLKEGGTSQKKNNLGTLFKKNGWTGQDVSFCQLASLFGLSLFPSVSRAATGARASSSASLAAEPDVGAAALPGGPAQGSCETSLGLLRRGSLCLDGGAA